MKKILKTLVKKTANGLGLGLHRVFPVNTVPPRLPEIALGEILDGELKGTLLEADGGDGNVSLVELLVINTLVAKRGPRLLFEIGTFDGRTTMNLAANAPGAQVVTLDLPKDEMGNTTFSLESTDKPFAQKEKSGARFEGTVWEKQIVQVFGDSARFDFSPYDGRAEVIFIDGSHAYDYAKNDTRVALKMAADSALILWHDYAPGWMGVVRALEEFYATGGIFKNLRHVAGTSLVLLEFQRAAAPI